MTFQLGKILPPARRWIDVNAGTVSTSGPNEVRTVPNSNNSMTFCLVSLRAEATGQNDDG